MEDAKPAAAKKAEKTHLVLTTSRVMGPEGKSLARGRIVLVPAGRAPHMIGKKLARKATEADIRSAAHPVVELA